MQPCSGRERESLGSGQAELLGASAPSPSNMVFLRQWWFSWLCGQLGWPWESAGRVPPAPAILQLEARLDHQGGGCRQSIAPGLSGFHRSLTGVSTRVGGPRGWGAQ